MENNKITTDEIKVNNDLSSATIDTNNADTNDAIDDCCPVYDEENMTEEERQKLVLETSMKILKKYKKAFEELAKL